MTFVDGVKYFDKATDAKDQRIFISPESSIDVVQIFDREDQHQCMQDAEMVDFNVLFNNK